jgi:hypothetical protein
MTYTTANDQGYDRTATTIEAALCYAVLMIYVGHANITQARQDLAQGKPVTITYGFKTVTITPEAQP